MIDIVFNIITSNNGHNDLYNDEFQSYDLC